MKSLLRILLFFMLALPVVSLVAQSTSANPADKFGESGGQPELLYIDPTDDGIDTLIIASDIVVMHDIPQPPTYTGGSPLANNACLSPQAPGFQWPMESGPDPECLKLYILEPPSAGSYRSLFALFAVGVKVIVGRDQDDSFFPNDGNREIKHMINPFTPANQNDDDQAVPVLFDVVNQKPLVAFGVPEQLPGSSRLMVPIHIAAGTDIQITPHSTGNNFYNSGSTTNNCNSIGGTPKDEKDAIQGDDSEGPSDAGGQVDLRNRTVAQPTGGPTLTVTPNPFTDNLRLAVPMQNEGRVKISLFNALGQRVADFEVDNATPEGDGLAQLSVSTTQYIAEHGIYMLVVETPEGRDPTTLGKE
jgi:hypothetical protein